MDKRVVFFQLYLNQKNRRDRRIIAWLAEIPRWYRSRTIKEILHKTIQGEPTVQAFIRPERPAQNAAQAARKLFASVQRESAMESGGE